MQVLNNILQIFNLKINLHFMLQFNYFKSIDLMSRFQFCEISFSSLFKIKTFGLFLSFTFHHLKTFISNL